MLDHISLSVSDIKKSKEFFLAALKPLGYELFMEWEKWVGLAVNGKPILVERRRASDTCYSCCLPCR